jgi:hypothetical protein
MNELTKRLLTAGALGTLTLYLIFESPLGFTALLVLAVLFGLYEFLKLNNIAVLYKIICASLVNKGSNNKGALNSIKKLSGLTAG